MNLSFENQGTNTFLVYTVQPEDQIDTMSLGMLTNNKIAGIAPTQFSQMDSEKYIKYNISAKVSAEQLLSGPVNKRRLLGLFNGIIDAMLSAEDYMLDPASLLLEHQYIFVDVSSCETSMICLPIMGGQSKAPDLSAFFKKIMFSTQFDQTENCDHIAWIINYLNSVPSVSLNDFKKVLEQIQRPKAAPVASQTGSVQPSVPVKRNVPMPPVMQPIPAAAVTQTDAQPPARNLQPAVTMPPSNSVPVKPTAAAQQPVAASKPHSGTADFAVPGAAPKAEIPRMPQPMPAAKALPGDQQKKMSWFYLMQHYNKENATLYKAQQEAKKKNKGGKGANASQKAVVMPAQSAPISVPSAANNVPAGGYNPQPPVYKPAQSGHGMAAAPGVQTAVPGIQMTRQQVVSQKAPEQPMNSPVSNPISFGETTVLTATTYGETTVLTGGGEMLAPKPYLVRIKNNERIPLNKPVFRIGKERSYVDYFIGDNTAISRSHANILTENGQFFIMDTNSTNHTYVNGEMIPSNSKISLSSGTKVRLANEEFEFILC